MCRRCAPIVHDAYEEPQVRLSILCAADAMAALCAADAMAAYTTLSPIVGSTVVPVVPPGPSYTMPDEGRTSVSRGRDGLQLFTLCAAEESEESHATATVAEQRVCRMGTHVDAVHMRLHGWSRCSCVNSQASQCTLLASGRCREPGLVHLCGTVDSRAAVSRRRRGI